MTGEVGAAVELLDRDESLASVQGGPPHAGKPVLYLSYSRLSAPGAGRCAVEAHGCRWTTMRIRTARLSVGGTQPAVHGAHRSLRSGEGDEPPHPDGMALARLLLEHGADPNDAESLDNRQWDPDDSGLSCC